MGPFVRQALNSAAMAISPHCQSIFSKLKSSSVLVFTTEVAGMSTGGSGNHLVQTLGLPKLGPTHNANEGTRLSKRLLSGMTGLRRNLLGCAGEITRGKKASQSTTCHQPGHSAGNILESRALCYAHPSICARVPSLIDSC